jgi:hypothetical protein
MYGVHGAGPRRLAQLGGYTGIGVTCLLAIDRYTHFQQVRPVIPYLASLTLALLVVAAMWVVVSRIKREWLIATALLAIAAMACFLAFRVPLFSWVAASAGVIYFLVRAWKWLGLPVPSLFVRTIIEDSFAAGEPLGAGWDEVHPGAPTQMIGLDSGLKVYWAAHAPYDETGYLLKKLPEGSGVRVEATVRAGEYGNGWDPGVHFYTHGSIHYCLSVGLIPKGAGPPEFSAINGVSVRTNDPGHPGWVEHKRVPLPPGNSTEVRVDIDGLTATVRVGDEVVERQLAAVPQELVVGAWKWSEHGGHASYNANHRVLRVRARRKLKLLG